MMKRLLVTAIAGCGFFVPNNRQRRPLFIQRLKRPRGERRTRVRARSATPIRWSDEMGQARFRSSFELMAARSRRWQALTQLSRPS